MRMLTSADNEHHKSATKRRFMNTQSVYYWHYSHDNSCKIQFLISESDLRSLVIVRWNKKWLKLFKNTWQTCIMFTSSQHKPLL